jgi:hypothetical protein
VRKTLLSLETALPSSAAQNQLPPTQLPTQRPISTWTAPLVQSMNKAAAWWLSRQHPQQRAAVPLTVTSTYYGHCLPHPRRFAAQPLRRRQQPASHLPLLSQRTSVMQERSTSMDAEIVVRRRILPQQGLQITQPQASSSLRRRFHLRDRHHLRHKLLAPTRKEVQPQRCLPNRTWLL